VTHADAIKKKGVDEIVCMAVNDPFVMDAWSKDRGATGKVRLVSDGNGEFTKALGLEMDKIENIYKYVKGRADKKIGVGRPAVKAEPEPASKS